MKTLPAIGEKAQNIGNKSKSWDNFVDNVMSVYVHAELNVTM